MGTMKPVKTLAKIITQDHIETTAQGREGPRSSI